MVRDAMDLDQPRRKKRQLLTRDRIRKNINRNIELHLQRENEEEITRLMSTVNLREKQAVRARCAARLSQNGCPNLNNPVDSLTHHLLNDEPYHEVFDALTAAEMEALRGDIEKKRLGSDDKAQAKYWEALLAVCELEIAAARRLEALPEAERDELERGRRLRREVWIEVFDGGFDRLTLGTLETMLFEIERRMRCGKGKMVEYYENRLKLVHVYKAKARLKEMCA